MKKSEIDYQMELAAIRDKGEEMSDELRSQVRFLSGVPSPTDAETGSQKGPGFQT